MILTLMLVRSRVWLNPKIIGIIYRSNSSSVAHERNQNNNRNNWKDKFATWEMFKKDADRQYFEYPKTPKLYGPALDADVITLQGNAAKLLDQSSNPNRSLVVNFGNYTRPPIAHEDLSCTESTR